MITKTIYCCEICGSEYLSELDAITCEKTPIEGWDDIKEGDSVEVPVLVDTIKLPVVRKYVERLSPQLLHTTSVIVKMPTANCAFAINQKTLEKVYTYGRYKRI